MIRSRGDEVWVALLRGINVGSRNRVPMAGLRDALEAAGCASVRTRLQSGNVVFTRSGAEREALASLLEETIAATFGVEAPVVLRTAAELVRVVGSHPFGADTSQSYVTFLAATPRAEDVRALEALDVEPDLVRVVGEDVFLRYPNGVTGARLTGAKLERVLGVVGTARNWRTVTALAALAQAPV